MLVTSFHVKHIEGPTFLLKKRTFWSINILELCTFLSNWSRKKNIFKNTHSTNNTEL